MLSIALLALLGPAQGALTPPKLTPDLRAALVQALPGERLELVAVLTEQLDAEALLAAGAAGHPRGERQRFVARQLRDFAAARQGDLQALLEALTAAGEVEDVRTLWIANAVVFRGTAEAAEAVAALPEVDRVGWTPTPTLEEVQDGCPTPVAAVPGVAPAAATPTPNLIEVQAPDLWALGYQGDGVVVLLTDAGVDYTHPDLANRIWQNPLDPVDGIDNDANGYVDDHMGWDFIDGDNDPWPGADAHGTQTGGILAGDGSSGTDQTGMAPGALLVPARVFTEADFWLALQYGLSVAVDASSSSYSYKWNPGNQPDYHMHRQILDAYLAAGVPHANSIGNQGGAPAFPVPFQIATPGNVPAPWRHPDQQQLGGGVSGSLGCGAVLPGDVLYGLSSLGPSAWEDITIYDAGYGPPQDPTLWDYPVGGFGGGQQGLLKPDLVAPTSVLTTFLGGGYSSFSGTSAATPHLGGALALLVSVNPAAEPRHMAQALQVTALDLGAAGKDNSFGAGKLQVRDAALRLLHLVKVDRQAPSLGDTVTVTTHGVAGEFFLTLWATQTGTVPLPGFTLDLLPPVFVYQSGVLDGAGQASSSFQVPNTPPLVGVDVYLQSGADDTAGVSGQILVSTVETFRIRS